MRPFHHTVRVRPSILILLVLAAICRPAFAQSSGYTIRTLYSFNPANGTDGAYPSSLLIGSDGNFYGTTSAGGGGTGLDTSGNPVGSGTIFKMTPSGVETTLFSFSAAGWKNLGANLFLQGSDGNFYGTTAGGGLGNMGTVFKMTPSGTLTVLYSFTYGGVQGFAPYGLFQTANGDYYGTAYGGADGDCTIFTVTTSGVLSPFYTASPNTIDGINDLIQASDGNFYGVAYQGGANGTGMIFKMTHSTELTTLYSFSSLNAAGANSDGAYPVFIIQGADGNFYGTSGGGNNVPNGDTRYAGTIFKITPAGALTTLHLFGGQTDGVAPNWLVQANDGNFYGCSGNGEYGYGVLFRITPAGAFTILDSYPGGVDCTGGIGAMHQAADGRFYGLGTGYGYTYGLSAGAYGYGSVIAVTPPSTTTLDSSPNPSTFGASVTLTATIKPKVPNGEYVWFYDGRNCLGGAVTSASVASFTTSTLAVGNHTIAATYAGDAYDTASTSSPLTQTVTKAITATSIISSLNPAPAGAPVTLTANLNPSVPSGEKVTFYIGGVSIGTGITSGGKALLTTSTLTAGTHGITASYAGDATYAPSTSSTLTVIITKSTTTLGIESSPNPTAFGGSVTFTTWLRPIPPNGETITFFDGSNVIGAATTSSGIATFTTAGLATGSHTITAGYPGDVTYAKGVSRALTQTVLIARPTAALQTSLNPAPVGASVTFRATLNQSVPNGETVRFYDGAVSKALIGTGATVNGVATLSTCALSAGSHTIWADYVGDTDHAYSWSSGLTQSIH